MTSARCLVAFTLFACGGGVAPTSSEPVERDGGASSSSNSSGTSSTSSSSSGAPFGGSSGGFTVSDCAHLDVAIACPDGSYARPDPQCGRSPICPPATCEQYSAFAQAPIRTEYTAREWRCRNDADCATVSLSTSCAPACTATISAGRTDELERDKANIEATTCKAFHAQGCVAIAPPCDPPEPPRCVDKRCK